MPRRTTATGARVEPAGELGILRGPIPYPPPTPLGGAAAALPAPKQFRTDDKGVFRVTGLPAGRARRGGDASRLRARRFGADARQSPAPTSRVTVVLSRGVAGAWPRQSTIAATPVGGAELTGDGAALATSDARGEWDIAHVARALTLTVRAPGFLPATRAVSPSERGPFDVTLERAEGRLAGDVVDDRGAPVSAARVEIAAPPMPVRWVTTDRARPLRRRRARARALSRRRQPRRLRAGDVRGASQPTSDARFALAPGGGIDGDVRDARLGGVPAGARLEVVAGGKTQLVPLQGGRFSVTALPAGRVTLTAAAPGYVTRHARRRRRRRRPAARRHGARRARRARARRQRRRQRARRSRRCRRRRRSSRAGGQRGRTDRDGNFRVDGVAPGRVRVTVDKAGASAADDVEVRGGDESRVELRLR